MMTRLVLVAIAAAAFALPAYADITVKSQDGSMELAVPNGWHEVTPEGSSTKLVVTDGHGARVLVRSYSKEDFKDINSVATFAASGFKLEDAQPKTEEVQLNGKPAVSMSLMGTEANGLRLGLVITAFDTEGMYIAVIGRAPASVFTKQVAVLTGMAKGLKVTPVAATPPAPPAPAAPQPPARK
jgi:hypothetical protein